MIVNLTHNNVNYFADLNKPIDISIPISPEGPVAWGLDPVTIKPLNDGVWVGDVNSGGYVNFNNIYFNPHAHTTHTECVGHISSKKESVNKELTTFFFVSKLITLSPQKHEQDFVINENMIKQLLLKTDNIDTLIIRTKPNSDHKLRIKYINTNPPYFLKEAVQYITDLGIKHLLIDLPSIDKERDGGELAGHKYFFGGGGVRDGATITELIYVPNVIIDGIYLLNLQFAPFENDAAPSRPVLFNLKNASL